MAEFINFSFEFQGAYHLSSIPIEEIDTTQYEDFWSSWGEFKCNVETTKGMHMNVWFDYELTADKDFSVTDAIGINNAYVNIYQKGEDIPIKTINPISIKRYEQE